MRVIGIASALISVVRATRLMQTTTNTATCFFSTDVMRLKFSHIVMVKILFKPPALIDNTSFLKTFRLYTLFHTIYCQI